MKTAQQRWSELYDRTGKITTMTDAGWRRFEWVYYSFAAVLLGTGLVVWIAIGWTLLGRVFACHA